MCVFKYMRVHLLFLFFSLFKVLDIRARIFFLVCFCFFFVAFCIHSLDLEYIYTKKKFAFYFMCICMCQYLMLPCKQNNNKYNKNLNVGIYLFYFFLFFYQKMFMCISFNCILQGFVKIFLVFFLCLILPGFFFF